MIDENAIADDLIPGRLKRSASYHPAYGRLTYGGIKRLAAAKPPDLKARQMKKLIEARDRIMAKLKGKSS